MTRGLRRITLLASAVAVCAAAVPAVSARTNAVTATLAPDSVSGVKGQRYTLTLSVNLGSTGKLLGSYTAALVWDSTVVRLDSVRSGSFGAPLVNYVSGAEVRLTQANGAGLGGTPTLALLYYRFVNDTVGRRTVISPTFSELTASDFTNLLADFSAAGTVARVLAPTVFFSFTPDSLRERVGFKPVLSLTADLSSAAGVALGSYAAKVNWDSTIMRLDSARAGAFAAPQTNQPNAGELRLTSADALGLAGAPFAFARLYYRFVNDSFPKQTLLTLSVSEAHAAVTFADLLPGVVVKSAKALIGGVLRGDIDLSGTVTALDAQLILQSVVGLSIPTPASALPQGDADCSAALRARDAQIVLHFVVGNDVSQFCAGKIQ